MRVNWDLLIRGRKPFPSGTKRLSPCDALKTLKGSTRCPRDARTGGLINCGNCPFYVIQWRFIQEIEEVS